MIAAYAHVHGIKIHMYLRQLATQSPQEVGALASHAMAKNPLPSTGSPHGEYTKVELIASQGLCLLRYSLPNSHVHLSPIKGQIYEAITSDQEIPEKHSTAGMDVDETHRFPHFHGLTSPMGEATSETSTNKFPRQMELQTVITLTEDQNFHGGQGPTVVVSTLLQRDGRPVSDSIQNGGHGLH